LDCRPARCTIGAVPRSQKGAIPPPVFRSQKGLDRSVQHLGGDRAGQVLEGFPAKLTKVVAHGTLSAFFELIILRRNVRVKAQKMSLVSQIRLVRFLLYPSLGRASGGGRQGARALLHFQAILRTAKAPDVGGRVDGATDLAWIPRGTNPSL
jgi:hypothetical protein